MRKNILIVSLLTFSLTGGLLTSSVHAISPIVNWEICMSVPQENYEKIDFEIVDKKIAPEDLLKKLNTHKDKEGYVCYVDTKSGYFYLAVMRGKTNTGGYGVNIKSANGLKGFIDVIVEEVNPDINSVVTQAIDYPCIIIKVKAPVYKINVKNISGHSYNQYGAISTMMPLIGVSDTQGILKNIYKEKDYLFLEVQNSKDEIELFYAENNSDWQNKFKDLKINDKVDIRYALGTPKEYKGKMAMPLNAIVEVIDKFQFKDEMWKSLKAYDDIEINKEWTISFTKIILNKDIDNSSVYITDSNGNKIPAKIIIMEDQKSLKVIPVNQYKYGETYYLFITNNLVPSTKLYKGYRMQFTVRGEVIVK